MASYQASLELLEKKLDSEYKMLRVLEDQISALKENMSKAQKDVEVLESEGIMATFFKLMQRYEGKLEMETLEYLGAKANYEKAQFLEQDAVAVISDLKRRIRQVKEELGLYSEALHQKKTAYEQLSEDSEAYKHYKSLRDKEAVLNNHKVQLQEALQACEAAIDTKDSALRSIGSAKSYSTWDTWFGGGLIVDSLKYGAIDNMKKEIEILGNKMKRLERELADIGESHSIVVTEIGGLTRFFDVFFDDFFSALTVKSHLEAQQVQIEGIAAPLNGLRVSLIEKLTENDRNLVAVHDQLEHLLMTDVNSAMFGNSNL